MLTIDHILKAGYEAQEIDDRIFLVHNFLDKSELDYLMFISETSTQQDWENKYIEGVEEFCEVKFGRRDVDNLIAEGKLEVTDSWKDKVLNIDSLEISETLTKRLNVIFQDVDTEVRGVGIIQRQYAGVLLKEHVDNHTDPSLDYATVIYLNDDYVDGEVFFSTRGIELKPPVGSMLIFPTDENYLHGVKAPGEGPMRYVMPSFVGKPNFYEHNKY